MESVEWRMGMQRVEQVQPMRRLFEIPSFCSIVRSMVDEVLTFLSSQRFMLARGGVYLP